MESFVGLLYKGFEPPGHKIWDQIVMVLVLAPRDYHTEPMQGIPEM